MLRSMTVSVRTKAVAIDMFDDTLLVQQGVDVI